MTVHYHGTPITPRSVLLTLGGKNFCVSFARPDDVVCAHQIGQSVMLDNGAYTMWTQGRPVDWHKYYDWCEKWLEHPTTWGVIPDVIDGEVEENDVLVSRCPISYHQSAPVWHLNEPIGRIFRLLDLGYYRICFGSSGKYQRVGSDIWHHRMTEVFNRISTTGPIPWIHMLRGMSLSGTHYPFASVDSSDIGRHHNEPQNTALAMANRWDALQCSSGWTPLPVQQELA